MYPARMEDDDVRLAFRGQLQGGLGRADLQVEMRLVHQVDRDRPVQGVAEGVVREHGLQIRNPLRHQPAAGNRIEPHRVQLTHVRTELDLLR